MANEIEDRFNELMKMVEKAIENRKDAKRTEISDMVIVDTCRVNDGWETAISLDGDKNYHVVERYANEGAAAKGHDFWVKEAKGVTPSELDRLGKIVKDAYGE
jgi:hypothetical protein